MPEKKGKYLSLEILPALSKAAFPLIAVQGVPAEQCPCWGQELSLALLAPCHCPYCLLRAAREHKPGGVSSGLVLCCSSLLRAHRWHSSSGRGREQRGWCGFCSLHVPPLCHLAPVTWW